MVENVPEGTGVFESDGADRSGTWEHT